MCSVCAGTARPTGWRWVKPASSVNKAVSAAVAARSALGPPVQAPGAKRYASEQFSQTGRKRLGFRDQVRLIGSRKENGDFVHVLFCGRTEVPHPIYQHLAHRSNLQFTGILLSGHQHCSPPFNVAGPLIPCLTFGVHSKTPYLAPRAPPSRLKPEMERMKVVVFLRERKQGAGHYQECTPSRLRKNDGAT
jgi:hypothetical protein